MLYDPVANITIKSSPYRTLNGSTEWICTQTDSSKRVILVGAFEGSTAPANCGSATTRTGATTTVYGVNGLTGAMTLITDPAGNQRRETRDALGRLIQVTEDPSGLAYATTYGYDALDNLVQVTQGTQAPRVFKYSSLARLVEATNPESGKTTYEYYASGELKKRTDARGVVAEFEYDPLHRIRKKTYSSDPTGTPTTDYLYYLAGAGAPKVGLLQQASNGVVTTGYDSYDSLGRVTSAYLRN